MVGSMTVDVASGVVDGVGSASVSSDVDAEFEALDAEGLAKYEALVQQDVERFRRECEERGIDPDELMSHPARRPDELRR